MSKITKQMIDAAQRRHACYDALKWLRAEPRTIEQLIAHRPDYFVWAYNELPRYRASWKKHLGLLVQRDPNQAVLVGKYLSDRQLRAAAMGCDGVYVGWLLSFKDRLSRPVLRLLFDKRPTAFVLQCPELLCDETLNRLALQLPFTAKREPKIWDRLTEDTRAKILTCGDWS